MSGFRLAAKRTRTADRTHVVFVPVRDPLVETSIRTARKAYGHFAGSDQSQREIRRLLWEIQALLTFTLLPFDDSKLKLSKAIQRLSSLSKFGGASHDDLDDLVERLNSLMIRPQNLKFLALTEWCDQNSPGARPHVLTTVSSRPNHEGWPDGAWERVAQINPMLLQVESLFEIHGGVLPLLVIPCSGQSLKASQDLIFFSGIAEKVLFLHYDFEVPGTVFSPAISGGRQICGYRISEPAAPTPVYRFREDVEIDDPVWADLRGSVHTTDETELISEGRWVRFDDGRAVCLPEGAYVPEVSELISAAGKSGDARLPRRAVESLRPGHVLLLRESGSGEYLDAVADALMKEAGESGLRQKTEVWRKALASAIRIHGLPAVESWVRDEIGTNWEGLTMLPSYVSSHVIGPRSPDRFEAILKALVRRGFLGSTFEDSDIQQQWEAIEKIRSFQFRAGGALRSRLLKYLQHKIRSDGIVIGTPISLPDVDAGELILLRVAAVDEQTCSLPTSQLYRLRR